MAVVVIVAPDAAESVIISGNTGLVCHVAERPVRIVAIKSIASVDAPSVSIAPVYEVDVLPAVVIEIGNTHSGTGFFKNGGDTLVALEVSELNARLFRNVG